MFSHIKEFFTRPSGYNINRSVRLRSSASAYLNRTNGSPTSATTFTHSFWVKRGALGSNQTLISGARPTNFDRIYFTSSDTLLYQWNDGTSNLAYLETTQVFRDPSAWYHIIAVTDTTQATSTNRVKIYLNGVQITSFSTATYPTQNSSSYFNTNAVTLNIGRSTNVTLYLDGYLTEINFIDGQALTPSSFGSTNPTTGVWQPAKYTGTYGTNGFYLNFSNNASTTTLGYDTSGNSNNWTTNNISLTAGATYDSMTDVPTLTSATAANYATFNAVAKASSQPTFSNGNLDLSASSAWNGAVGTIGVTSGKWYWEVVCGNSDSFIGICGDNLVLTTADPQTLTGTILYYGASGQKRVDGTLTTYGASYTTETIGVALDIDGGTITFYKSNSSQGSILLSSSTLNGKTIFPFFVKYASTTTINFGQRPFSYTPPSGYVALNTYNLPASTIVKGNTVMDATLYTGTGSTQSITNTAGFKPDLVWVKARNSAVRNHRVTDSVRGVTNSLCTDLTAAEVTEVNGLTAFLSNGFTIGSQNGFNASGETHVAWQWQAGQGSSSSNTNGSITSTVSVNATAGFSVVTYTGTGASATVGHGLGVAPSMIIVKRRDSASAWDVYHQSIGATGRLYLNTTDATNTSSAPWNNTAPTSSVFTVGTATDTNNSGSAIVAYCWSAVAGFSKFGSYTGNGSSDGPFVYCGFRPRWIMVKNTTNSGGATNWTIQDSSRNGYNPNKTLYANAASAEDSSAYFDILSNGFKVRDTFRDVNTSGDTYIYAVFAENPLKYAIAR